MPQTPGGRRTLGIFSLAMINVAAVMSIRNFPSMAEYGWASVTFLAFGTLLFLIPISIVAAELATGWPKGGGMYAWVREAFGQRQGFLSIWCEWTENLVWFPTALAFLAATLAYGIDPHLATNKLFLVSVMLVCFWGSTVINFFGMGASKIVVNFGTVAGTLLPSTVIIGLGIYWFASSRPLAISFDGCAALLPSMSFGNLVIASGVILMFAGMEMAGFHALETKDPAKDYAKAILLSAAIIFCLSVAGILAVAISVPRDAIVLTGGVMQAFQHFFHRLRIHWLLAPIAILISLGVIAQLNAWLLGPAKGIQRVALDGNMPPTFRKLNRNGVPVNVLLIQGVVGSLFSLLFLFIPSVSTSYWMLTALTTQITAIYYILIFASVIRLRYTEPNTPRPYKVPGGMPVIWILGGAGIAACTFALVMGHFPPSQLQTGNPGTYTILMIIGAAVLALPSFLFYHLRKPSWRASQEEIARADAED